VWFPALLVCLLQHKRASHRVFVRFAFNNWRRNQSNLLNVFHPNIPRHPTWINRSFTCSVKVIVSPRRIAKSKRGVGKAAYSEKQQEEWFGFLFYRCLIATSWCFIHLFGISFLRLCQGQCYYSVFYIEFQYVVRCVSAATFLISVFADFRSHCISVYNQASARFENRVLFGCRWFYRCTPFVWVPRFLPQRNIVHVISSYFQDHISVVKFTPEFQATVLIWRISPF